LGIEIVGGMQEDWVYE
jgi:hypothetical protein